jgi:hypothetical protein
MKRRIYAVCMDCSESRRHEGRGLCSRCYQRRKQTGTLPDLRPRPSAIERFLARTHVNRKGCWIWEGAFDKDGYATFASRRNKVRAARFSYEFFVGPIAAGLQVDHLCRVHSCVNPAHLEAVTPAENTRRGNSAQLCDEDVRFIRKSGLTNQALAERFDVDPSTISLVRSGKTWLGVAA